MFIKTVLEYLVHRNFQDQKYKLKYKTINELIYCFDLSKALQRNTCNPRPTLILKTHCIIHFVYVQKIFSIFTTNENIFKKRLIDCFSVNLLTLIMWL